MTTLLRDSPPYRAPTAAERGCNASTFARDGAIFAPQRFPSDVPYTAIMAFRFSAGGSGSDDSSSNSK